MFEYDSLSQIATQSFSEVTDFLPRVIAAILILIVGGAIAKTLKGLVVKLLETLRVSSVVKKTPVEHFLKNADLDKLENVLGSIFYWLVMLVVIQTTVSVLGLESLSLVLDKVLLFVPQIISAIIVLFVGVLVAGVVESLVKGSIKSINGKSARLLGKVSSYLVMTIVVLAAINELGIASEFIMVIFIGFITTVSLGLGLAIGLGGKDVVSDMLNTWYKKTLREVKDK